MSALSELFQDIADAIRSKTGNSGKMKPIDFPNEILNIEAGGSVDSNLVKYVTFMSEDGTSELFEMPVLNGDDCKDPVTHGDIDKPTKESTNTTNYTHNGWSLVSGGGADKNALKTVVEDRSVYSAFAESVRYYTVNFYDEDGVTLLYTMEVTYRSDVSDYVPNKKDGYVFAGWTVDVTNITSDVDTVAIWEEETRGVIGKAAFSMQEWQSSKDYDTINHNVIYSPDGTKLFVETGGEVIMFDATVHPPTYLAKVSFLASSYTWAKAGAMHISADSKYLTVGRNSKSNAPYSSIGVYEIGDTSLTLVSNNYGSTNEDVASMAYTPDEKEMYCLRRSLTWVYGSVFDVKDGVLTRDSDKSNSFNTACKVSLSSNDKRAGLAMSKDGTKLFQVSTMGVKVYDLTNNFTDISSSCISSSLTNADYAEVSPDGRYLILGNSFTTSSSDQFEVFDMETLDSNGKYTKIITGTYSKYGNCYDYC